MSSASRKAAGAPDFRECYENSIIARRKGSLGGVNSFFAASLGPCVGNRNLSALPTEWAEAPVISTFSAHFTAGQLEAYSQDMETVLREKLGTYRSDPKTPGARPVQLHFHAFPLIDSEEPT